jgi:tetratricopeptide (TPR) repeat protein
LAEAWEALEIVRRDLPDERSFRSQRGNLLLKMAMVSAGQGQMELAERQFLEAKETWSALARDYPDAIQIPEWIAEAEFNFAQCLFKANRAEEARHYYREALAQMETLLEKHPEIPRIRDRWEVFRGDPTLASVLAPVMSTTGGR